MHINLCIGEYSGIPYTFQGLGISVYCAEELSYALFENVYLLDSSLMNTDLVEWIGNRLKLVELARTLETLLNEHCALSRFVTTIMEYIGFYDAADIKEMDQKLKMGSGLSNIEKRKSRVDYLVSKKQFLQAIKGYDALMKECGENVELRARISHNRGVAYIGMMMYERAAESFMYCYENTKNKTYLSDYIAAMRLFYNDDEYKSFVDKLCDEFSEECADLSREVEAKIAQIKASFMGSSAREEIENRRLLKENPDITKYYEDNETVSERLKNEYRFNIGE